MRLRRVLGGVAGTAVGLGVTNAVLRRRAGQLSPPLGEIPTTYRWRGIDVSVTEAGDPDDPDLVLLHGINVAATSREFRPIFEALAEDYHVIAPDFPGFGRSERPPLVYSARLYEDFVREFLHDEADRPACVAASLSGAYAVAADPDVDVRQLVLVAPTATTTRRDHWVGRGTLRLPLVGSSLFNALTTKPMLGYRLRSRALANPTALTDEDLDYYWRTAHQPGARYAPASFLSGTLDPELDLAPALAASETPATLVWGRDATRPPLEKGRRLADRADRKLIVIDRARAVPHLDQPDAFLDVLESELAPPA